LGTAGSYRVSWTSIDYALLKFIQLALETDQPIYERKAEYYDAYGYKKVAPSWYLQIYSKELVTDLMARGITPRKSKTLLFDDMIEEPYMKDYIRGIFDGDGSIGEYVVKDREATNFRSCIVSGSRIFLEQMGQYLKDHLHVIPKIREMKEGTYVLNYGIKETVALCRYMYSELASFALARKKAIYDSFMVRHPHFCIRTCSSCSREFVATTGLQCMCKPCKNLEKGRVKHNLTKI
jgi:hypothetical protein